MHASTVMHAKSSKGTSTSYDINVFARVEEGLFLLSQMLLFQFLALGSTPLNGESILNWWRSGTLQSC